MLFEYTYKAALLGLRSGRAISPHIQTLKTFYLCGFKIKFVNFS